MKRTVYTTLFCLVLVVSLTGCMRDMQDQPRYDPLQKTDFFEDGRSSRPIVEGTIPRGGLKHDSHLYTGKVGGEFVTTYPFEISQALLDRGQDRYDIFCSVCHGKTGAGDGMVVQRGFPPPPSFHTERLRDVSEGYLFNVMTNGFGKMSSYSDQLNARDRWAVVAYLRALQLSQNASLADIPRDHLGDLDKSPEELMKTHDDVSSKAHH